MTDSGEMEFPDADSLSEELDLVFARHNDVVVAEPELIVALLVNMADGLRDKFNVEVGIEEIEDEKWLVEFGNEDAAGFIGFERDQDTGQILDSDLADGMEVNP